MISITQSIQVAIVIFIIVVAVFLFFYARLRQMHGLTESDRIAAWEVFTKAITSFTAIAVGLFAFVKYIDQRESELKAAQETAAQKVREFNITIYGQAKTSAEAKRVTFNEVADLVATLAMLDQLDNPTGEIAVERFERLYHGQLVIHESDDVRVAMINFRDALHKWQKTHTKPTELLKHETTNGAGLSLENRVNSDFMKRLALKLSEACKIELDRLDQRAEEQATRAKSPK